MLNRAFVCVVITALFALANPGQAADIDLFYPVARSAYQTNETIAVCAAHANAQAAGPADMVMTLNTDDGGSMVFHFAVAGTVEKRTEHLHLNGAMLRPGKYTLVVEMDGGKASLPLEICSHIRQSDYRLINWGRAQGDARLKMGVSGYGYNLFYGECANDDKGEFVRAGVDLAPNCVMGGGHQMDLRTECDWSDPYVTQGGTQRGVRFALHNRDMGNVPAIHLYDEPGLTWWKDPATGKMTPHGIPAQVRSYQAAFDVPPPAYLTLDPSKPEDVAAWKHWAVWKLGFMNAAWKDAQFGISYVKPAMMALTQSVYGFAAITDGYYFNVVATLPVTSGHGGYDDWGPGFFNPTLFLEIARARDLGKPCWYLPTWYGNTPPDRFRLEQYLSFMTGIQGMLTPPDLDPANNPLCREVIAETNRVMGRLGPIFTNQQATRPPVAMLFSLSNFLDAQAKNRSICYSHDTRHGVNVTFTYLAGKMLQQQFMPLLDEEVIDGTLAQNHKAIILTSIDYLDPAVVKGLEAFIATGGLVLKTSDSAVQIKGAVDLGVTPALPDAADLSAFAKQLAGAKPLAEAIRVQLEKARIAPVFQCDNPSIVATRQVFGDVEYLFAVNATYDPSSKTWTNATTATIGLADDGRPVYDVLAGGVMAGLKSDGKMLAGKLDFGPGQMRVLARTARPIGQIKLSMPEISTDFARIVDPIQLRFAATLTDDKGGLLSGSVPVRVLLTDSLGQVRYDLYRATTNGVLAMALPLAANDPGGTWRLSVQELLANTQSQAEVAYRAPSRAASVAGITVRAARLDGEDQNVFRFFRVNHDVTIVKAEGKYDAAAERLKSILAPWNVRCKIETAAHAAKSRTLTKEEAETWSGMVYGRSQPGDSNPPELAGFAIQGPVILLGTPEDNPLIKFVAKQGVLPYEPSAQRFPGNNRGYLAWQRDVIGRGQESITLIGYDAQGISEAVGSMYEAAAGIEPLTPWNFPQDTLFVPAKAVAK